MRTLQQRIILITVLLSLICAIQVSSLPFPVDWKGLLEWTNAGTHLKPVGASCRDHSECDSQYCWNHVCAYYVST